MITGKDVVLAAKKDLESFFEPPANFKLEVELESNSRHHASIVGTGKNTRIRFSNDFCCAEVNDIDELHYFALIVGHEIAHYMHAHNDHADESEYDSKSIEAFSDFFGTRMMMTLITYGQEFISFYEKLGFNFHSGKALDSVGAAIAKLADSLFKSDSQNYPNCISRVGFCAAGVTSFLDNQFGDINVRRSIDALAHIYAAGSLPQLFKYQSDDFEMDSGLIVRSDEVHKAIQNGDSSISKGVKPEFLKFIDTSYHSTLESRESRMELMRAIAKKQGYDVPKLT